MAKKKEAQELSDREMEIALYGDGRVTFYAYGKPGERIFNSKEMDAELDAEIIKLNAEAAEWLERQRNL